MKRLSLVLGTAACLGFCAITPKAQAASISGLPPEIAQAVDDLQATMYPPVVESVEVGSPAAGAAVSVKAKIVKSSSKGEGAEEATLFYSTDGCKSWQSVDMSGSGENFTGEIPGQASGTTVNFIITAKDLHDNLYTEISCKATPEGDMLKPEEAGWQPLATNEGDPDGAPDIGDASDADLNITTPRIAATDEFVFFEMQVKGKIKPGTSSPMNIHAHAGGLINRDKGDDDLLKGVVMVFAPLAKLANYQACMAVYEKGGQPALDPDNIKCKDKDGSLVWRIPKNLIGDNPSGQIKTMMVTGAITNIQPLEGKIKDHTRISLVNLKANRSYSVP